MFSVCLVVISLLLGLGWCDPPDLVNPTELAKTFGQKVESHEITTSDGFILTLHRFANEPKPEKVILLTHGIMCSSEVFYLFDYSLANYLHKKGYDVWMANSRGNVHSRKHKTLKVEDPKFWDFSFHEMGLYDTATAIDYILEKTKQKQLIFLGHSLGNNFLFVLLSEKPEYNDKISKFIALGPTIQVAKYKGMLGEGSSMVSMVTDIFEGLAKEKKYEAFPRQDVPKNPNQIQCEDFPDMAQSYCTMGLDMSKNIAGSYTPAGTSLKTLVHYFQLYQSGEPNKYSYSEDENNSKYKSKTAPKYDLKNVKAPTYLFYAEADQILDPSDVETLATELPNVKEKYKVEHDEFNHMDFIAISSEEVKEPFEAMMKKLGEILK